MGNNESQIIRHVLKYGKVSIGGRTYERGMTAAMIGNKEQYRFIEVGGHRYYIVQQTDGTWISRD